MEFNAEATLMKPSALAVSYRPSQGRDRKPCVRVGG